MRYDLVVNTFTVQAVTDGRIEIFGGNQWRPFVHIRDLARGMIYAAEKDLNGIYNLARENITINELGEIINRHHSTEVLMNDIQTDPRNYRVDNSKFLATGYEFAWDLDSGIKEMLEKGSSDDYHDARFSNMKLMQAAKQ
jgi:nucleoside-diphosphate-sugar epimerase